MYEMGLMRRDQILNKAVCISLHANVLGKGIYPFLLSNPVSMGKTVGQNGFLSLVRAGGHREWKSFNSKPEESCLRKSEAYC